MTKRPAWPVLKRYDIDHSEKIALPLGGIGTGTISLGGRGDLRDFEVGNRPAKGFTPRYSFFALWAKAAGGLPVTRCLEGPIPISQYEGGFGSTASNHGLPRFASSSFSAAYPFGQVHLKDKTVPLEVRIEAFNPLIPGDVDASSIPAAIVRFVLINRSGKKVDAAVCGSMENFVGRDGSTDLAKDNLSETRKSPSATGVFMRSRGVDPAAETFGTLCLATTASASVTCRTAWADVSWNDSLLDFWDDFSADGKLEERDRGNVKTPMASLAVRTTVPPRSEKTITFLITWHFPNRMTWSPAKPDEKCDCAGGKCGNPDRVGNFYTTRYADAWDAATRIARDLADLESRTLEFVRAFCDSDLPEVVKEAALFNVSTLRTQTTFRAEDGHLYGWEGCGDRGGCCHGSCTHVWNYEQATAFLFGDMARSMRDVEFAQTTEANGLMRFRADLPLGRRHSTMAAADGQMGCLMKLYREWTLCGDDEFLKRLWPGARRALEFCWVEHGWDGDRDGIMEGCQHNTMDVEYYGPNPQMQGWYLGALRAAEEMARHLGENDFAAKCRSLYETGRRFMDQKLFNGEYYEHEIRPAGSEANIAAGLRHESMGARNLTEPELQIGAGCLIDQLVGQYMAHVVGLGYLHNIDHVGQTLASLMRYNFKRDLRQHFNHMRSFALQEESAMLMCSYPRGCRPKRPFPYYTEVMTGFEYTAAVGMLYEGMEEEALEVISAIRARYDGAKRSPFDEAECGHHYARAMASWGAVLAISGFDFSAVRKSMAFAAKAGTWFWSNGSAWGNCTIRRRGKAWHVDLTVLHGELSLVSLGLHAIGERRWDKPQRIAAGQKLSAQLK